MAERGSAAQNYSAGDKAKTMKLFENEVVKQMLQDSWITI